MENLNKSEIIPPWKKYPKMKNFLTIWKKGNEDGYLKEWSNWFSNLPKEKKVNYKKKYPEPKMWADIYEDTS